MNERPEEIFEQAVQAYVTACAEWKAAVTCLLRDVGMAAARPYLEDATDRICSVDAVLMSPEEVAVRAARARTVVDAYQVRPKETEPR